MLVIIFLNHLNQSLLIHWPGQYFQDILTSYQNSLPNVGTENQPLFFAYCIFID